MKTSPRVIVLVLLTAAASVGVLYYISLGGPSAAQPGAIPDLVSLIPADTSSLLYADVVALRSSPFLAQLAALTPAPPTDREYAEFVRDTGFDYTRDLDRAVLAVRSGSPAVPTVVIAEGRFDRGKIAGYALRSGKVERQEGLEVYLLPGATPTKTISFAFLGANRVALADGPELGPVLSARPPTALDPAMRERISRVAGSALFAVGHVGSLPEHLALGGVRSDQFSNLVRSLRWFSLAARPESERLRVTVEGECDTSENARQLAGALDGLRLLGQAALADPKVRKQIQPEAIPLLETLLRTAEISRPGTGDDKRIRLTLELTPEMLKATMRKSPAPNSSVR